MGSQPTRKGVKCGYTVKAGAPAVSGSSSSLSGTINAVGLSSLPSCCGCGILIAPDVRLVIFI